MSQHDYIIENQSGGGVRADLNQALSAIATQNSGAASPSVTYPYMFWADTTNDLLKQRDSANTSWIPVIKLSTGKPAILDSEYFQSTTLYSSNVSNAVTGVSVQLALPAGDFDVTGTVVLSGVSAVLDRFAVEVAENTTMTDYANAMQFGGITYTSGASGSLSQSTRLTRFSLPVPSTINLLQQCYFGSGSLSITHAILTAKRVK